MNLSTLSARYGLATSIVGAFAFIIGQHHSESVAQERVLRVKTSEAQVRTEPGARVTVERRSDRPTFRVAEIRAPDIGIWFDPAATDSLVIADIATTGPIAQLDLQEGDRILEVNGVKVTRETDFLKLLFATRERERRVDVLLVRKNKEMVIGVEPALLADHYTVVRHDPLEQLGLVVDDRYDDRVVVWKVLPRSPAFYGGIRPGDVITRFGDQRVVHRKDISHVVETVRPGALVVEVDRARRVRPIRIEVPRDYVGITEERDRSGREVRVETEGDVRRDAGESAAGEVRGGVRVEADAPPKTNREER
jgi:predicted metalloprotease with PDZ domain